MRARGYKPFGACATQDAVLDQMIATAQEGSVGIFDLDGCVFDTRPRQSLIFREYGVKHGVPECLHIEDKHFLNWDLKKPFRLLGIAPERIEEIFPELEKFWRERFFTSEYVLRDIVMPGAFQLLWECYHRGMTIVYLTGRDHNMRRGTEECLRWFGLPYDIERTHLITKPVFSMQDTAYKMDAVEQIESYGEVVLTIDNEPSNINAFAKRCPSALSVFMETDHSFRKDTPDSSIPRIRSFYRTTWFGAEECDLLV